MSKTDQQQFQCQIEFYFWGQSLFCGAVPIFCGAVPILWGIPHCVGQSPFCGAVLCGTCSSKVSNQTPNWLYFQSPSFDPRFHQVDTYGEGMKPPTLHRPPLTPIENWSSYQTATIFSRLMVYFVQEWE